MTRTLVYSTVAVLVFIALIMLAQGIGQSVGHGLTEWGIR